MTLKKVYLIYGNNLPLLHFREQQVLNQFKDKFKEALHLLEFSKEPFSPLEDEPSLFEVSTKTWIHLSREAHLVSSENLTPFFELPGHYLLLSSPKINSKSKLLSLLSSHRSVQIYKCYELPLNEFKEIVLSFLTHRKTKITPQALTLLYESFEHRMDSLFMELEKLALFGAEGHEISVDGLKAMGHQKIPQELMELTSAVLVRHLIDFTRLLKPLLQAGHEPIALGRHLLQHFFQLQKVHLKISEGFSFEQAFTQQKPPLFFGVRELYQHAIKLWSFQELQKAVASLLKLEKDLKLQPHIVKELLFFHLYSLLKKP